MGRLRKIDAEAYNEMLQKYMTLIPLIIERLGGLKAKAIDIKKRLPQIEQWGKLLPVALGKLYDSDILIKTGSPRGRGATWGLTKKVELIPDVISEDNDDDYGHSNGHVKLPDQDEIPQEWHALIYSPKRDCYISACVRGLKRWVATITNKKKEINDKLLESYDLLLVDSAQEFTDLNNESRAKIYEIGSKSPNVGTIHEKQYNIMGIRRIS